MLVACIFCARETNHTVLQAIEETGCEPIDSEHDYEWSVEYQIIQCGGCDAISFRRERSNSEEFDCAGEGYNTREDLYPSRINNRQFIKDIHLLPVNLGRIYQESILALNSDQPILSGIGIRAILETVGNEEQAPGNNLARKIDALVAKGVLTQDGANILHKIRALGNQAAHSVKAHTPTELKLAMDVIEHLLQAVYILPHHAKGTF